MDTISINAGEAVSGGQEKKKNKLSDNARSAMATGAAGVAAGASAKTAYDAFIKGKPVDDTVDPHETTGTNHHHHAAAETATSEQAAATTVNPNDVMLEDPEEETVAEAVPEPETPAGSGDEVAYQPFSNDDPIAAEEEVIIEPEEILYAGDVDIDMIADEDLLCGMPTIEEEYTAYGDGPIHDDPLMADNGYDDSDNGIQTDLMA